MIFLQTDRLLFRTHEPADEAAFVEMHTDPDVRRYAGGRAWWHEEATRRFRERFSGRPDAAFGLWATVLREQGTYVGMCGISGTPANPHLAYYIARPYWGIRLASEAAAAFVEAGFTRLKLQRILADADKGNVASERILTKLGFHVVEDETLGSGRMIHHYELRRSARGLST
jgi:RimJ/RimL family protein N-acetyltransferase